MNSAVIQAVVEQIDAALGTTKLFYREHGGQDSIQGARPAPPYALFRDVTRPADPNKFDEVEIIALLVWAGEREIRGILAGLRVIDDLWIPRVVDVNGIPTANNIRCKFQSRPGPEAEPEARMPSPMESYALWKSVSTWRVTYADLASGQSWEAVM